MPQESINYPEPYEAQLSIHWSGSTGGQVAQVGLAIPTKELRQYLEGMTAGESPDHHVFWYTPRLTRDELNKLIRIARRARNAVYGTDE